MTSSVRALGLQRFIASFTPHEPGTHTVQITFNGEKVPGKKRRAERENRKSPLIGQSRSDNYRFVNDIGIQIVHSCTFSNSKDGRKSVDNDENCCHLEIRCSHSKHRQ